MSNKRVVTLEELELQREKREGTNLWYRMAAVQRSMMPERLGGGRCRVTRPESLSKYGPGDKHLGLDFVKGVYSDRTGQE